MIASTALITYTILMVPGRLAGAKGPPEEFLIAATHQAQLARLQTQETPTSTMDPGASAGLPPDTTLPSGSSPATPTLKATIPADQITPTSRPASDFALPEWVDVAYWLSIPAIGLEAPIIALGSAEREIDGITVSRLLVPNSYSVSWDVNSAEPGFVGNTILAGHHNAYGGVFADLHTLNYGAEIAIWSEYGVFSYYVSVIEYVEEDNQSLEVRYQNAHWLDDTSDDRVTLITCWPQHSRTHRLIVVGVR